MQTEELRTNLVYEVHVNVRDEGDRLRLGQPVTVLGAMTFPIGTRQIGPDDAVTSDFRPERLNIEYGRTGRIEKVGCY